MTFLLFFGVVKIFNCCNLQISGAWSKKMALAFNPDQLGSMSFISTTFNHCTYMSYTLNTIYFFSTNN